MKELRFVAFFFAGALLVSSLLSFPAPAEAFSVLAHEAVVDFAWNSSIRPALLARFPGTTDEELTEARKYAYGGCLIQDMGYFPFGSKLFSDLLHYVRSGDLIRALLRDARDVNEYAFALGALSHYAADELGHPGATNRAVAIQYPELERKFGPLVTYEDKPSAHIKVEFGFDVLQVARGAYKPESYHGFIGFEVSKDLLGRAFEETYGLKLDDVFGNVDRAIGTYRFAITQMIPELLKVAWTLKKDEIQQLVPGITQDKFMYRLSRKGFEEQYGRDYQKPGWLARMIAFLIRIMPKIGPFKTVSFKPPTPETEALFQASFQDTVKRYDRLVTGLTPQPQIELSDVNLDTGKPYHAGDYFLADRAYARLVRKLGKEKDGCVQEPLLQDIKRFYQDAEGKMKAKDWKKLSKAIAAVKSCR